MTATPDAPFPNNSPAGIVVSDACSAPPLLVEMTVFRRVMAYLSAIESVLLEEIAWTEGGVPISVTPEEIQEWKFTGLNNRDFALMVLESKRAQNAE